MKTFSVRFIVVPEQIAAHRSNHLFVFDDVAMHAVTMRRHASSLLGRAHA